MTAEQEYAEQMLERTYLLPEGRDRASKPHIESMLKDIRDRRVEGEKAHRWIGWVNAAFVVNGEMEFSTMKQINANRFKDGRY